MDTGRHDYQSSLAMSVVVEDMLQTTPKEMRL